VGGYNIILYSYNHKLTKAHLLQRALIKKELMNYHHYKYTNKKIKMQENGHIIWICSYYFIYVDILYFGVV